MISYGLSAQPQYYAVIFTSLRTEGDNGYAQMAQRMVELASKQPGFLGYEAAREEIGISLSYWDSLESIKAWKENLEHRVAQERAREWYKSMRIRICRVERDYESGINP